MSNRKQSTFAGMALGAAVIAGAAFYYQDYKRKHPLDNPAQRRINRALDSLLLQTRQNHRVKLNENARYVIFSDHHKGAGDGADDFRQCKSTYLAALDYYDQQGFTLILLGDVEELWENKIQEVMETYPDVFLAEKRFFPQRYIRIQGNHDDPWKDSASVAAYLEPYYPDLQILPGLIMEFDCQDIYGEILLAHGHQGTLSSDILASFPPHILPIYRQLQNFLHIGHTTPATDYTLRGEHDTQMYRWASQHKKLVLVAGHTHRPIWSSLTHLDQLYIALYALRLHKEETETQTYQEKYKRLVHDIEKRMTKDPPVNETFKTIPAYFNTGCCRFKDGDITGIEITADAIRLVKWDKVDCQREQAATMSLAALFARL